MLFFFAAYTTTHFTIGTSLYKMTSTPPHFINVTCERRKERARTQRLYLLGYEGGNRYRIQGSTAEYVYTVTIQAKPTCTCPDYTRRHYRCKHIFFMLLRYLRVPEDRVFDVTLPESILNRESERLQHQNTHRRVDDSERWIMRQPDHTVKQRSDSDKTKKEIVVPRKVKSVPRRPISDDDDCPICLEPMLEKTQEPLVYCEVQCGQNMHLECMSRYAKHNHKWQCPLCRAHWRHME